MTKAQKLIKRFTADEQGTALIEYTMLLGTFVVAVILVMSTLGSWITAQWQTVCTLVKAGC
jgi:Flp pilus assembly pilin Flp